MQGGVKYTIPAIGTIYTDVTLNYLLLANANNNTAAATEYLSPLFFNFAIGFTIGGVDWHAHLGGLIGGWVITKALSASKR